MIIGTAGHIDHGKTSLVKALTGIDADRLPEEKARGITIDLGFAYVPNAQGDMLGFVDVPGHEKFVHTMAAGAAGMDHALLVIAADDGVMPQTAEHLRILDLLGVPRLTATITKVDMVDTVRVDEVSTEVKKLLATTRYGDVPLYSVSTKSGVGLENLRQHLFQLAQSSSKGGAHFRLPIDRVFVVKGVGVAVTGAVISGEVCVGDTLLLGPRQREVKVRSIHAQNKPAERAGVGTRCGLVISGVEYTDVARGDWLTHPALAHRTERIDCCVRIPVDAEKTIKDGEQLLLHYGTEYFQTRLILLDTPEALPGQSVFAQCVLEKPLPVCWHDRLVFRDSAARYTLAGGVVLDIDPPIRGRKKPTRIEVLHQLVSDRLPEVVGSLLKKGDPINLSLWTTAMNQSFEHMLGLAQGNGALTFQTKESTYAVGTQALSMMTDQVIQALSDFHKTEPDEPGLAVERLRRISSPHLAIDLFKEFIDYLIANKRLALTGSFVHLPDHQVSLTVSEQVIWEKIYPRLIDGRYDPPWVRDLASALGEPENNIRTLLRKVSRTSQLVQLVPDLFYPVSTMHIMADMIRDVVDQDGHVTVITFKDRVSLGRKRAIQILEAFDRLGFTRRLVSYRRGKKELEKDHRIIRNAELFGGHEHV